MFPLNKNLSTFYRIGDRYKHFFDFNHFLGRNAFDETWLASSRSKISKDRKYYEIDVALPGLSRKEIKLELHQNILSIQLLKDARVTDDGLIDKDNQVKLGQRKYSLPDYLDLDGLNANLQDGVLRIRIPYKPGYKQEDSKTIEVE